MVMNMQIVNCGAHGVVVGAAASDDDGDDDDLMMMVVMASCSCIIGAGKAGDQTVVNFTNLTFVRGAVRLSSVQRWL